MHTRIFSATTVGVDAHSVHIEVDLSFGMINFYIVGLPDAAIKESRQRITTALKNSGMRLPEKKITVNLAPADLKKEGTLFDLPIALGILHAAGQVQLEAAFIEETLVLGELSLDGSIRGVRGVLPIACDAQRMGKKRLIIPYDNADEAALIDTIDVIPVRNLTELIAYLRREVVIEPHKITAQTLQESGVVYPDFSQVRGQRQAKRALQIAAAGHHNILFIGPPGSGKTMLAQRLPSIMPRLSFDEMVQTSKIYSISGKLGTHSVMTERPFRAPHHTISSAGLVGGGSNPQPGEISLAHNGILFLDELPEFRRDTLEVLRQPLENKEVCISRAHNTVTFPAGFLLVAALNPCPCGYLGDTKKTCSCSSMNIARYLDKISGPLLDRIDIQVNVQSVDYQELTAVQETPDIDSATLYKGVLRARQRQQERFGSAVLHNATMSPDHIVAWCKRTDAAEELVKKAFERLHLSMRGYHKLLKVARTIADLDDVDIIEHHHVQEAIMYRSLDAGIERFKSRI